MTTNFPTRLLSPTPLRVATVTLCLMLGGCTVTGDWFSSDRTDYKNNSKRTQPLDVPPDLTQLQRDSRYLPQGGVVTASDLQKPGAAGANGAAATPGAAAASDAAVALATVGDLHVERQGNQRWLATRQSPEEVWPKVREFWATQGYTFKVEDPAAGILETDWLMNRASLPQNFIHDMLGKVLDGVYDSGLRDRYRTRLERQPDGSTEIFVTQFGAVEEVTGVDKSSTQWVPRPNDPGLEAQQLSAMMLKLGGVAEVNVAAATAPKNVDADGDAVIPVPSAAVGRPNPASGSGPNGTPRARVVAGQAGAAMQVDDNFDRSWRRVGLALDHGGFTVEDRDRAQGIYYVRYTDAKQAAKDEPGFFSKFTSWLGHEGPSPVGKYRIAIKASGDTANVSVLNDQGQPDNSDNAKHIVALLVDELK